MHDEMISLNLLFFPFQIYITTDTQKDSNDPIYVM